MPEERPAPGPTPGLFDPGADPDDDLDAAHARARQAEQERDFWRTTVVALIDCFVPAPSAEAASPGRSWFKWPWSR
jgi:hypothetical protein